MSAADEPDRPDSRDREAIDRAFADLVAGYHLTADRPSTPDLPARPESEPTESVGTTPALPPPIGADQPAAWAEDHPLFRFDPGPESEPEPEPEERYVPPPPEALPKPAWPVLVAWLGMGYATLMMLAVVVGVRFPSWAGWLAILGFVGGFGILVTRLPRERPPGDGAVL